ncbi:hypothetical protein FZEAL_670 [Fusarium zealandicum]|uniref:Glucose-methanol-choline oxidoreductase N-terminal domain-containing protein n=1 Tax=Fusarium zealandicum TaxID=1053134 RepID=A0A8H4UUA0_9HYPO|nr:hypothetical protein FZEAL_670 [Fusarium zealandicum]
MSRSKVQYDFIIVGSGPAGCSIARGLANTITQPSVLLVEAGSENNDVGQRIIGNQYVQMLDESQVNPYESTPQNHLAGRKIGLTRGKGLGGSTAVNFTAWTIGPRDDWDTMAELTGDPDWGWQHAKRRFKQLETYHDKTPEVPGGMEKYLHPQPDAHGYQGPLHIGFAHEWDHYTTSIMDIWAENGYKINLDMGSGDSLGMSIVPKTMHRGTRATAADLLYPTPGNLHIKTNAPVHCVVFENKRAVGVALLDGTVLRAKKEVILAAGSLDTPKILMHSGIGPADQLSKFGIQQLVNNPSVGQNYKDHYHIVLKYARAEHTDNVTAFFRSKALQEAAKREWELYRTGPYVTAGTTMNMGFFKSDAVLKSKEFNDLPTAEKERIQRPTIPTYEVSTVGISPEYYTAPETTPPLLSILVFVHNSQGIGNMQLASADPAAPLIFNPDFVSHPYDQRVIVESTKEVLKVTSSEAFKRDAHPTQPEFEVPASDSDEDILDFWRKSCTSTWHMSGTCKMGRTEKEGAVVDPRFRVFGVSGLRVADLSIMPIIASAHTQSTAYQVGMVAAEKIAAEYSLNGDARL